MSNNAPAQIEPLKDQTEIKAETAQSKVGHKQGSPRFFVTEPKQQTAVVPAKDAVNSQINEVKTTVKAKR